MKDMVAAVSAGVVDHRIVVDLDGEEEHITDLDVADIPIAMVPSTEEITLIQMDGKASKEELFKAIEIVKPVLRRIVDVQRKALKEKYKE